MSHMQSELAAQLAKLRLTPRLIDVVALLLQGKSNKVIARDLSLSTETVKEHVASTRRVVSRSGPDDRSSVLRVTACLGQCPSPTHAPTLVSDPVFGPVRSNVAGRTARTSRRPNEMLTISR